MIKFDNKCTACGACAQICPKHCISFEAADLGTLYPKINEDICVNCGMCENVCPIHIELKQPSNQKAFAVVHNDSKILLGSSSGGFFSALAQLIIGQNGIVYGCAFDKNMNPVTIGVDSVEELYKLRGSKYVQSDTTSAFIKVKTDLLEGRPVLFTGTPCQVAGLKSFLGKPYDHLICVDLICHGVPSSQYFLDYLHHLEHKTGSKIQGFNFRDKRTKGWGLSGTYEGTREGTCEKYTHKLFYFQSYYYSYFLHGETYRESCYSCKYASLNRVGDFTMGDLWGAEGMRLPFSVEGGCSLVIANSIKAQELLNALEIQYAEVPLEVAVRYNQQLQTPSECPRHREDRIKEYKVNSAEEIERYFFQAYRKANCIAKLKYLTPMWLKKILLRFR